MMGEWLGLKTVARPVLQKLGLHEAATKALWYVRQARYEAFRRVRSLIGAVREVFEPPIDCDPNGLHRYDVICLPVMSWHTRVQRPQQLMRQLASRGHRIFYGGPRFFRGKRADTWRIEPNVFEMMLPGTPKVSVYKHLPSSADVERMVAAIDVVRHNRRITSAVVVVQLPTWIPLAERLREAFGWPIVYDCMDDHAGFTTNGDAIAVAEKQAVAESDLVVVTADLLHEKVLPSAQRTALIRNACDYEHFAAVQPSPRRSARMTVGFYGAIAEWFDNHLVADMALMRPDWDFQLIGSTFTGDVQRLKKLPNVTLLGEKPYKQLPCLVAGWDCFIVPFKRMPLTEATNPVKVYEMLATGKPVVAVSLPELLPMGREGLITLADTAAEFVSAIERASADDCPKQHERRKAFAAENTWSRRCDALEEAVADVFPSASIILVAYNNLKLNQACLRSIFMHTDRPNYEVIVVDNASSDGTAEWLAEEAAREPRLKVILNRDNRGYAAGNNQALRLARGDYICLLNNDTVVARGWLTTLIRHLQQNPRLGMVGPVSNMVGNEAIVQVSYKTVEEMPRWAERYCREHDGESVPMQMLGFFCVVMRRAVFESVGELDERFGLGYFEDDDFCRRVRNAGYQMCFVRDAFVHHFHRSSFKLLGDERYQQIFDENRRKYEEKWEAIEAQAARKMAG